MQCSCALAWTQGFGAGCAWAGLARAWLPNAAAPAAQLIGTLICCKRCLNPVQAAGGRQAEQADSGMGVMMCEQAHA